VDEGARRFERIANFRDLGGHVTRDGRRVATGRLFRSGHLAHATEADRRVLAQLGLRRVFDFRTQADVGIEGPDRLPDGVVSVALPMADPAMGHGIRLLLAESSPERIEAHFGNGKAEAMMRSSAAGLVRERREPYGAFLRALAEPGAFPALFHCSAGKDRAGWAGSVVLLCLGVPEEQVIEQYLRSNRATEEILARYRAHGREGWSDVLRPLLEVRREYIEAAFEAVAQDWGDSDRYLEDGLGITAALRDAIRENLLDGRG
jgi:protein-tyrosine phosphatase